MLETPTEDFKMVGLGIFYSHGFHAHHEDGRLDPKMFGFEIIKDPLGKDMYFSSPLGKNEVWFQVWKKSFSASIVYLIDTDISINKPDYQNITKHLYGPDKDTMLDQQIILGTALPKIFSAEKITPDIYHLNEGHTAMSIIGLAEGKVENLEKIKNMAVATKHTILTGGGMYIERQVFREKLGFLENPDAFFDLGTGSTHPDTFSTTNFLLRYTKAGSAVSIAHAVAEKQVHPHSNLIPITNGINKSRWQKTDSTEDIWLSHQENKAEMIDFLEKQTATRLSLNTLTVTWARRFASYKRPDLLFKNIDELTKVTKLFSSVQFIIAGQTNPKDEEASDIKEEIKRILEEKALGGRICFLDSYNLKIARFLVSGSDVWLNTPTPGIEASGTSGMKAGINGILEFTTKDGWIPEVDWTSLGWIIPENNITENLYRILEKEIIPLYYQMGKDGLPSEWIRRMEKTKKLIEEKYTSKRLLEDYWEKLYNI